MPRTKRKARGVASRRSCSLTTHSSSSGTGSRACSGTRLTKPLRVARAFGKIAGSRVLRSRTKSVP
eukprot:2423880-Lingulodinium_polyedra.AAC.1